MMRCDIGPFSCTTAQLIETYLDPMLHRQVAPFDLQFHSQFVGRYRIARDEEILPRAEWTQGEATSRTLSEAARVSGPTVVFILDEANHEVSLGTNIDTPLHRRQCGGPVVDLDGNVVGITVCPSEYGCMAIPSASIRRIFEELKSGGLIDKEEESKAVN